MKYSIATPCYNGYPKLGKCLGSVRSQAGGSISVEHIVQDGGSTDETNAFLSTYKAKYSDRNDNDYTCLSNSEPDTGMYNAINKAWERSSGEILSWLNVDEQYLPGTLNKVDAVFSEHPEIGAVWGNFLCVNEDGSLRAARKEIPARYHYLRNMNSYVASCTVFFRRSLWDCGWLKLDESYRVAADHDLYLRLLKEGVKMFHINEYLSLFEMSSGNLSVTMHRHVLEEGRRIFNHYGSFKNPILRKLIIFPRWMEKLMRGAYRPRNISYTYVMDDELHTKDFFARKADPRFRF